MIEYRLILSKSSRGQTYETYETKEEALAAQKENPNSTIEKAKVKKIGTWNYTLEEFIDTLCEVPKDWSEYKNGERYYSDKISDFYFITKKEAKEYYKSIED